MLSISSHFSSRPPSSPTAAAIAQAFGLQPDQPHRFTICDNLSLDLTPGQILFISGPSGSGKSCLLRILQKLHQPNLDLDRLRLHPKKILPDHFTDLTLDQTLYFLAQAGLADAQLFLRTPPELSDGQIFRFKLALALARRPKFITIDQFTDSLDRVTAQILAHNIRKFATKFQTAFLLASPHSDVLDQLQPDLYLEKLFAETPTLKTRRQ